MNIPKIADAMEHIDDGYILEAAESGSEKGGGIMSKRKTVVLAAIIAACVCLAAFSYTLFDSKEYLADYDVDPTYMLRGVMLASSGDNYFGIIRTNLGMLLASNSGGETEPICQKEDCDHANADCDARLWWGNMGISAYDGRVYWATIDKNDFETRLIRSCSLDGDDITTEKTIAGDKAALYPTDFVRVHRGYMYFAGGSADGNIKVIAEELGGDGSDVIFDKSYLPDIAQTHMYIYANTMYLAVETFSSDGTKGLEVNSISLQTGGVKCIYKKKNIERNSSWTVPEGPWISPDGKLYYLSDNGLYSTSMKPLSGEKLVLDLSDLDPKYNVLYVMNNKVVCMNSLGNDILVKAFDGAETLLDISSVAEPLKESYGEFYGRRFVGADDKNLYYFFCDDEIIGAIPLDGSDGCILIADTFFNPS